MNLREHVKEIEEKFQAGQNLFRRQLVGFLLERISQLEQSAQQSAQADLGLRACDHHFVPRPPMWHEYCEFCNTPKPLI